MFARTHGFNIFVLFVVLRFLNVWPKGHRLIGNHLSVYLYVANEKTLGTGWRRTASFYYVALNQSGKELYRSPGNESYILFMFNTAKEVDP